MTEFWIAFALGSVVALAGVTMLLLSRFSNSEHPTGIKFGGYELTTGHVGVVAMLAGLVFCFGVLWRIPHAPAPTSTSTSSTETKAVTATEKLPAPGSRLPSMETLPSTTSAVGSSSSTPSPTGGCAPSGPWSVDSNGLKIIVTEVKTPPSKKLVFTFRVENNSGDGVSIASSDVLVVDSNGQQYEIGYEGLGPLGEYIDSGRVVPVKIDLATPLQGTPASVELRFNINQSGSGFQTLPVCIPVPLP